MKIFFICGSAEPGKDGVGDCTRRLCGKHIRTGHQVLKLSFCNYQVTSFTVDYREIERVKVVTNQIPSEESNI